MKKTVQRWLLLAIMVLFFIAANVIEALPNDDNDPPDTIFTERTDSDGTTHSCVTICAGDVCVTSCT